jgi:hypothetical protein
MPPKQQWRSFADASEFVRSVGLKNQGEWSAYAKSEAKPSDIPADPRCTYSSDFRRIDDWLGTGSENLRALRSVCFCCFPWRGAQHFATAFGRGMAGSTLTETISQ